MKRQISLAKAKRMMEAHAKEIEIQKQKDIYGARIATLSAELDLAWEQNDIEAEQRIEAEIRELMQKIKDLS